MKKLISFILCLFLMTSSLAFTSCSGQEKLSFYAPDGAPALAIAKFINDKENFGLNEQIEYNVVSSDKIGVQMSQGIADIMVMPINAASKLYKANKDEQYKMAGVLTNGNLYIMSSNGVDSLQGLVGTVVGVIGQGLVPDLTFKAILNNAGIEYEISDTAITGKVAIKYFAAAPDLIPLLKQGILSVGLLPEPAATNLTRMASEKTWTRLDVQELYDSEEKAYPQAVLMIKNSVIEKYPNLIDSISSKFAENVNWIADNTELAVNAVNGALKDVITPSLVASNINQSVVLNCKIQWKSATESKEYVKNYVDRIIAVSANSAKAITDDFFA